MIPSPRPLSVLLCTDEASDLPGYMRRIFTELAEEPAEASPRPFTRGVVMSSGVAGMRVHACGENELVQALMDGAAPLGLEYDAVALISIRVWAMAKTLGKWVMSIRTLPDSLVMPNRSRIKFLPVIVGTPLNLPGQPHRIAPPYEPLFTYPFVTCQHPDRSLLDAVTRGVGLWQAQAVTEAGQGRIGISVREDGLPELDTYVALPARETALFGPPSLLDPVGNTEDRYFRLPRHTFGVASAISDLENTLQNACRAPKGTQEPMLQACLERNPILVTRAVYECVIPRPALRSLDPLQGGIVPDFIAHTPEGRAPRPRPEVLEIKTATAARISRGKLSSFFLAAVQQVNEKYRRYFNNARNEQAQRKRLGFTLGRPRFALLLGRTGHPEEAEEIHGLKEKSEWGDMSIITYDDILGEAREMERALRNTCAQTDSFLNP